MTKHVPLYDRLLVRVISQGERTSSGLYRPQMAIDNTPFLFAEVIEAGHGRITSKGDTVPLIVKKGDMITFFRYANGGEQLCFPDPEDVSKELMLIREAHVTTVVEGMSALIHEVAPGRVVLQ